MVPPFDNSYARLPEKFYTRWQPDPVSGPALIRVNRPLARELGFDPGWLESDAGVEFIAGNRLPEDAEPIATVYAGHQFGGWNPQLGDGRAILLGEVISSKGVRHDIQLKGSGRTPYSRGGDGRAPLGPVLREYVVSEAMARLGVPTSRALAAVTTGEWVYREERLPGAVLMRVAQSHIRIGTVQYFAARQDRQALELLLDHVVQRHYPEAAGSGEPARAVLDGVVRRQASLLAQWQLLGFIHGVMNTDNMLLSGETIDYGPCAFMDAFDPAAVFSSIDHGGRYSYQNQPHIGHWNLGVLAQCLLPLLDDEPERALAQGQAAIDAFPGLYQQAYRDGMREKLGLSGEDPSDDALAADLLELMRAHGTDFTLTFRRLTELADPGVVAATVNGEALELPQAFGPWLKRWRARLGGDPLETGRRMCAANPVYIPRNHLVEEAIEAAVRKQDFGPFHELVEVLSRPFAFEQAHERYASPPRPEQVVRETFCGT